MSMLLIYCCCFFAQISADENKPLLHDSNIKYFNRHFILVVDQTINNNPNKEKIKKAVYFWLKGNAELAAKYLDKQSSQVSQIKPFDSDKDQLSLFSFALTGDGKTMRRGSSYARIHRDCYGRAEDTEYVYKDMYESLIHPRGDFEKSDWSFDHFFDIKVSKLFNGKDELNSEIQKYSAVTLSHYVFPLIFNFINVDVPSKEYILIIVSDFKSGNWSFNDTGDIAILEDMMANRQHPEYAKYVKKQIENLRKPFVQSDYVKLLAETRSYSNIQAFGTRLVVKQTLDNSPIFISSNLTVRQKSGSEFEFGKVIVSFNKDASTKVNKVEIEVTDAKGNVLVEKKIANGEEAMSWYDETRREFNVPKQFIDLGRKSFPGSKIRIKYNFYTKSVDKSVELLPFVFSASIDVNTDDISMINKTVRQVVTITIITLLLLLFITYMIYKGKYKKLECAIGQFSQKYVDVNQKNGALELPCWFYENGQYQKSIQVQVRVKNKIPFSFDCGMRLYARLQDGSPNGFSYFINGKSADNFIEIKRDKDKNYKFNINFKVNPQIVNLQLLHTCKTCLDFKIESLVFGKVINADYVDDINPIQFFFFRNLGTSWVGIDPGTTGSCVAYGNTGGALNDPRIRLVSSYGREVIPSKLVLKDMRNNKSVDQLIPGIDYSYGIDADTNWDANIHEGRPCFQSIKKLLGYKNKDGDKIMVRIGNSEKEFSGLELAHLLVKGLKKDMDTDINALSNNDKHLYIGENGNARRAVVAIPNNYTLPKIIEMIDSVKMLKSFDEVRYVYEAEGILFNYFRKNFKNQKEGKEVVMVYDMGGATINISIFEVEYINRNNTIYYHVHTRGRIGYAVGGDNIDVALMEQMFQLAGNSPFDKHQDERHEHQLNRKNELLKKMFSLKQNIIYALAKETSPEKLECLYNSTAFRTFLRDVVGDFIKVRDSSVPEFGGYFPPTMAKKIVDSDSLKALVYNNVKDAVAEILDFPAVKALSQIDTLIFAGRSTLFPNIQGNVNSVLNSHFMASPSVYEGFSKDEIKTSVAYGACWYGIYNSLITLDNSRLSGAYGFKNTENGETNFNILLGQNKEFDKDGHVHDFVDHESRFDADGNVVDFYQAMGSGKSDDLFSDTNRHKMNYLGTIVVPTATGRIEIDVDRRNVITCKVTFDTGETTTISDLNIVGRDITKENDWAYVFATTQSDSYTRLRHSFRVSYNEQKKNKSNDVPFVDIKTEERSNRF